MDPKIIDKLLEAIAEVVDAPGAYREKVEAIKAHATEQQSIELEEFTAWFDETPQPVAAEN